MVEICHPKVDGGIFSYSEFLRTDQIIGLIVIHNGVPGGVGIFVGQVIHICTDDLPVLESMLKINIAHDMAPFVDFYSCHPEKGVRGDGIIGIGNIVGSHIPTVIITTD